MPQQHETVGHRLRSGGTICLCFKYIRAQGFWLRVESVTYKDGLFPDRKPGDEICISERAVGRTYFRDHRFDEHYEAHSPDCECYICQPREVS